MNISTPVQSPGPVAPNAQRETRNPKRVRALDQAELDIVSAGADGCSVKTFILSVAEGIGVAMISTMQSGIVSTALDPLSRKLNVKSESFR